MVKIEKDNNYPDELKKWARDVIEYCEPFAKKLNTQYVPFIFPVSINTEVLVIQNIGIIQFDNFTIQRFTVDDNIENKLLSGQINYDDHNRYFSGRHIPFLYNMLKKGKCTNMKFCYFSHDEIDEIKKMEGGENIMEFFKEYFIKLVNILKPRIIVAISTDCLRINKGKPLTMIKHRTRRLLTKSEFNGIAIWGVQSNIIDNITSKTLLKIFNGETIQPIIIAKRKTKYDRSKERLNKLSLKEKERLVYVEKLAKKLMAEHKVDHFKFEFGHSTRYLGLCCYSGIIKIEFNFALDSPIEAIRNTILHEIAHAIVGPEHGHREVWQKKARELGVTWKRKYHK